MFVIQYILYQMLSKACCIHLINIICYKYPFFLFTSEVKGISENPTSVVILLIRKKDLFDSVFVCACVLC